MLLLDVAEDLIKEKMKTILITALLLMAGVSTAQVDTSAKSNTQIKAPMWAVQSLSTADYTVYTNGKDTNVVVTALKLGNGLIEVPDGLAKITGKLFICVDGLTEADLKAILRKIAAMRELNLPVR